MGMDNRKGGGAAEQGRRGAAVTGVQGTGNGKEGGAAIARADGARTGTWKK